MFSELKRVRDNPRLIVLVANAMVELFVHALAKAELKNPKSVTSNSRDFPLSTRLIVLHEASVISAEEFKFLNWLRKLRNKAAHEPFFELQPDLFYIFDSVQRSELCAAEKLESELTLRLGMFWNAHNVILSPAFMPSLHGHK